MIGPEASAFGSSVKKPTRPSASLCASPRCTGNLTFVRPLLSKFPVEFMLWSEAGSPASSSPSSARTRARGRPSRMERRGSSSGSPGSVLESAVSSRFQYAVPVSASRLRRNCTKCLRCGLVMSSGRRAVPGIGTQKNALTSFLSVPPVPPEALVRRIFWRAPSGVPRPS